MMFKKILIGVAAGAGILTLGYVGLIAYTVHAITKGLNEPWEEVES
jgi:hypothetical protein